MKNIIAPLITTLATLAISSSALAAYDGQDTVKSIQQYESGNAWIEQDTKNCSARTDGRYTVHDSAQQDSIMALVTAAWLSGKKINIGYNISGGECVVYSVQAY